MNRYRPETTHASLISLVLTTVLFGAIGLYVWFEANEATPVERASPAVTTPEERRLPPGSAPSRPPARDATVLQGPRVFKCMIGGRLAYQDVPCEGAELAVGGGTLSTIPAQPVEPIAPVARLSARAGVIARRATSPEPAECVGLRAHVRRIDDQARRRSSDALTQARKSTRDRMADLRCQEIDR